MDSSGDEEEVTRNPLEDTKSGLIKPDYFSLHNQKPPESTTDSDSGGSDNPSWIEPTEPEQFLPSPSDSFCSEPCPVLTTVVESNNEVVSDSSGSCSSTESVEGEKRKKGVWWKLMKIWVMRLKPVWSVVGVAAAVTAAFVIGRKLYRLKSKGKVVPVRIGAGVDEKKASQSMGPAARLNEAFSLVRRMPIVRPLLPAGGVTPWPVVGLL